MGSVTISLGARCPGETSKVKGTYVDELVRKDDCCRFDFDIHYDEQDCHIMTDGREREPAIPNPVLSAKTVRGSKHFNLTL